MKINILFFASVREMFNAHKKDVEILDSENDNALVDPIQGRGRRVRVTGMEQCT